MVPFIELDPGAGLALILVVISVGLYWLLTVIRYRNRSYRDYRHRHPVSTDGASTMKPDIRAHNHSFVIVRDIAGSGGRARRRVWRCKTCGMRSEPLTSAESCHWIDQQNKA